MAFSKRDKEWLSSIALHLRGIAQGLDGEELIHHKKADAPKDLRKIAEALERAGAGQL